MVLRIEETSTRSMNVLALSGAIGSDDVQMLKSSMSDAEAPVALDLSQVHLVNLDAVRFLAALEKRGVELRNCRPHVRAWITAEMPRVGDLE